MGFYCTCSRRSQFFNWSAMDSHSKREVPALLNMNKSNVIAWSFFLNPSSIWQLFSNQPTLYLHSKMLRLMSSLCVPNFNSFPFSFPKIWPINNFSQVNPSNPDLELLEHFQKAICTGKSLRVKFFIDYQKGLKGYEFEFTVIVKNMDHNWGRLIL